MSRKTNQKSEARDCGTGALQSVEIGRPICRTSTFSRLCLKAFAYAGSPDTGIANITYDSVLNLQTQLAYDALERVQDSTDAKGGKTSLQYDGGDQVTQVTDPRNIGTQYVRNGLGERRRSRQQHGGDDNGPVRLHAGSADEHHLPVGAAAGHHVRRSAHRVAEPGAERGDSRAGAAQ